MDGPEVSWYLIVSAFLFSIGTLGVLLRRSPLIVLLSLEIMLNAANLAFVAFSRYLNNIDGQVIVFFVITIAAAEAAVGLGIILVLSRRQDTVDVTSVSLLKD